MPLLKRSILQQPGFSMRLAIITVKTFRLMRRVLKLNTSAAQIAQLAKNRSTAAKYDLSDFSGCNAFADNNAGRTVKAGTFDRLPVIASIGEIRRLIVADFYPVGHLVFLES
jgi:hypothetical protein